MLLYSLIVIAAAPYFCTANILRHKQRRHLSDLPWSRPTCDVAETCRTNTYGYRFSFCGCPNDSECPDGDFSHVVQGIRYDFCQKLDIPVCEKGQLAHRTDGIQVKLSCTCPDYMHLERKEPKNGKFSEFTCESLPVCAEEEMCRLETFIASKTTCTCPGEKVCVVEKEKRNTGIGRCKDPSI
ncbi:unnamed protein product, partial [Mesorhabditis spiculigera]